MSNDVYVESQKYRLTRTFKFKEECSFAFLFMNEIKLHIYNYGGSFIIRSSGFIKFTANSMLFYEYILFIYIGIRRQGKKTVKF